MKNTNIETEISFRFLSVDKFQAFSLYREIFGSSHRKHHKNDSYVCCVPLTEENFEDINNFYVRQRVELNSCDIFMSVSSASDTGIVDTPNIVNRMLKHIDCKLTFSFTVS